MCNYLNVQVSEATRGWGILPSSWSIQLTSLLICLLICLQTLLPLSSSVLLISLFPFHTFYVISLTSRTRKFFTRVGPRTNGQITEGRPPLCEIKFLRVSPFPFTAYAGYKIQRRGGATIEKEGMPRNDPFHRLLFTRSKRFVTTIPRTIINFNPNASHFERYFVRVAVANF